MENLLTFVEVHRNGIGVLFLGLVALVWLVQWVCWIFEWGRFGQDAKIPRESSLRFVIADLLVKIINDFRHLLALVVMVIFALALFYALLRAESSADGLNKALQSVVASLGGLIGSIIGYYFGESAGRRTPPPPTDKPAPKPEGTPAPRAITPVPEPEALKGTGL